MEDEKEMAEIRKIHEKKIIEMKENYYKELYNIEIRAAIAKAELAELQLEKEKENQFESLKVVKKKYKNKITCETV